MRAGDDRDAHQASLGSGPHQRCAGHRVGDTQDQGPQPADARAGPSAPPLTVRREGNRFRDTGLRCAAKPRPQVSPVVPRAPLHRANSQRWRAISHSPGGAVAGRPCAAEDRRTPLVRGRDCRACGCSQHARTACAGRCRVVIKGGGSAIRVADRGDAPRNRAHRTVVQWPPRPRSSSCGGVTPR